jgi:hypothetical protein
MFAHWRGDVIFKFRIVASPYHKGRLRISFDPSGSSGDNILNDAVTSNVVFTEVIDLGEQQEVEFRVPYQQATAYLRTPLWSALAVPWSTSASPTYAHSANTDNGTISVRVQTALTAPVASSTVAIMVFVRGADNMEFANPREMPVNPLTTFQVQSKETVIGTAPPRVEETRHLLNFGECIMSLRPVLRRTSMVGVEYMGSNSAAFLYVAAKDFLKIPPMYGYDTGGGIQQAKGIVATTTNFNFNFVQQHPLTWVLPAFVGYRGSTNWTFNSALVPISRHVKVSRINDGVNTTAKAFRITATAGGGSTVNSVAQAGLNSLPGLAGSALTNQYTNAGISVACPMQTMFRFESTNPASYTVGSTVDGSALDVFRLEVSSNNVAENLQGGLLWSYAAIGTDFNAHFFLNVPTWISYVGGVTPT